MLIAEYICITLGPFLYGHYYQRPSLLSDQISVDPRQKNTTI